MIKVFYFYFNKNQYYSSTPIINNIKILFQSKSIFIQNNIDISPFIEFIPELDSNKMLIDISKNGINNLLEIAIQNILIELPKIKNNYSKIIFLGFHPNPFNIIQKYYYEIKKYNCFTILWQDDLHAYFNPESRIKKLDFADLIITPSPIYLKNINSPIYDKSSFFFYSVDFKFIKGCSQKFNKRKHKIILSGCVNPKYKIRNDIYNEMITNQKFSDITVFLKKPKLKEYNYKNKNILPYGINYYKILGNYKGAFFGYYEHPLNFNLAKIIEILSVGCIGFFEESPLLKEELGLIPYVHYVPCTKDGVLITKIKYYEYFLSNEDGTGQKIAEEGRKYVEENFSNKNGINNYLKIFNDIGK